MYIVHWEVQLRFCDAAHLKTVVGPRAEFHNARLLIEGEVLDVDLAGRFVNGGRAPLDATRVVERRLRRQRHLEIAVGAADTRVG